MEAMRRREGGIGVRGRGMGVCFEVGMRGKSA